MLVLVPVYWVAPVTCLRRSKPTLKPSTTSKRPSESFANGTRLQRKPSRRWRAGHRHTGSVDRRMAGESPMTTAIARRHAPARLPHSVSASFGAAELAETHGLDSPTDGLREAATSSASARGGTSATELPETSCPIALAAAQLKPLAKMIALDLVRSRNSVNRVSTQSIPCC